MILSYLNLFSISSLLLSDIITCRLAWGYRCRSYTKISRLCSTSQGLSKFRSRSDVFRGMSDKSRFALLCQKSDCKLFHTPMARCSLFVLKVPLNANKPNQTLDSFCALYVRTLHMCSFDAITAVSCRWGDEQQPQYHGDVGMVYRTWEYCYNRNSFGAIRWFVCPDLIIRR